MNIQTLTKNYRERFVAFNKRIDEIGTDPKKENQARPISELSKRGAQTCPGRTPEPVTRIRFQTDNR